MVFAETIDLLTQFIIGSMADSHYEFPMDFYNILIYELAQTIDRLQGRTLGGFWGSISPPEYQKKCKQ